MASVVQYIATFGAIYHSLVVGGVFTFLGIFISPLIHRSISLSFALILLFLTFPARGGSNTLRRPPWYDGVLIGLGIIPLLFIVFFQDQILDYGMWGVLDVKATIFAFSLMVVVLEGSRRASDSFVLPGLLLLGFFVTIFNNFMPGLFHGSGFTLEEIGLVLYVSPHGIFGVPLRVASTVVVMFMIFAQILRATGGSQWLIKASLWVVGRSIGGPAKAAIVASAAFGTISGSPSSNSAATGIVTIPLMKRTGYSPEFAAAVEATASAGGQILPPVMGAVAFVIAEWLEIRYVDVILAALVPALLYFSILFYGVDLRARRDKLEGMKPEDVPLFSEVVREGWFYLLPIALLVYLLIGLQYPPGMAALSAIVGTMLLGLFIDKEKKRLSIPSFSTAAGRFKEMLFSMGDGMQIWVRVAVICAAVGILVGCFTQSGVGLKTSAYIIQISGGRLIIVLLLAALAAYILGMGMDTLPLYMTMAILVAPALEKLGVYPLSAHLFVLFWGLTSFITPPVCLAVYVTSAIAESNVWESGFQAMRLGIILFIVPFAFVYFPGLQLIGSFWEIFMDISRVLLASAGIVGGLIGFPGKRPGWMQRVLLVVGGLIMLMPGLEFFLLGLILAAVIGIFQYWVTKRSEAPAVGKI